MGGKLQPKNLPTCNPNTTFPQRAPHSNPLATDLGQLHLAFTLKVGGHQFLHALLRFQQVADNRAQKVVAVDSRSGKVGGAHAIGPLQGRLHHLIRDTLPSLSHPAANLLQGRLHWVAGWSTRGPRAIEEGLRLAREGGLERAHNHQVHALESGSAPARYHYLVDSASCKVLLHCFTAVCLCGIPNECSIPGPASALAADTRECTLNPFG
mmetsp:Transcript_27334/g.40779  ORF Transcript_27334/g.40779 Transcript_27334/m.40779 type:complete len:210 (-) Transcript_27334:72-701(-)